MKLLKEQIWANTRLEVRNLSTPCLHTQLKVKIIRKIYKLNVIKVGEQLKSKILYQYENLPIVSA